MYEPKRRKKTAKAPYIFHRLGWKGLRAGLSLFVVAGTVGSLMLPAVTLNQECQLQEHHHSEECLVPAEPQLICTYDTLGVHVHEDSCYDEEKNLICGMADFLVHTHEELCYDASGNLVCTLPEMKNHRHSESCYQQPQADPGHTHGDACYDWIVGESLICNQEASAGHAHEDTCYGWTLGETLTCTQEESVGHTHAEGCYASGGELLCGLEADAEHTHEDGCYAAAGQLLCTQAESQGHVHADSCRERIKGELACTLEESTGHAHTDDCYEKLRGDLTCQEEERLPAPAGEPQLVCEEEEILPHLHVEECYAAPEELDENGQLLPTEETAPTEQTDPTQETLTEETDPTAETEAEEEEEKILICPMTVVDVHQHTENCLEIPEGPSCGLEEHTHVNDCFPDQEPPVETPADWEAGLPALTGDWNRDLAQVALSQLGYTESTENKIADETGVIRGYTRYGHWAQTPHDPWQTLFLSFCLNYAKIPQEAIPTHSDLAQWQEALRAAGLLRDAPVEPAAAEEPAAQSLASAAPGDTDTAAETTEPAETIQPTETTEPAETTQPPETTEPAETTQPTETTEPAETTQPEETTQPGTQPAAQEPEVLPQAGDLVFLDRDGDGAAETGAILTQVTETTGGAALYTIEGDYEDAVVQLPYEASQLKSFVSLAKARETYLLAHPEARPYVRTHRGEDYSVTVHFGDDAQLPQDVTLSVRELSPDSEEYLAYVQQVNEVSPSGEVYSLRLFDITFLDALGQQIEPAAQVDIQILYDQIVAPGGMDCTVIHFAENAETPEVLTASAVEQEMGGINGMTFSQNSFSISAVMVAENLGSGTGNITTYSATTNAPPRAPESSVRIEEGESSIHRVADPSTMNQWQEFFVNDPEKINTSRAGGVFMDKSVTTGSISYWKDGTSGGTLTADPGGFMVGLSAIGTTQQVAGVESMPTDVMFILDLSSSMYGSNRTDESVSALVTAMNASIATLNALNDYNRIGVTVYYGGARVDVQSKSTHGFVMLPLARYKTTEKDKDGNDVFLKVILNGSYLSGVDVVSGVSEVNLATGATTSPNSRNYRVPETDIFGTTSYVAGTYAQLGLLDAMNQFANASTQVTTTLATGQTSTVTRQPVFIFMSDGLPTAATPNFAVRENATMGNNSNPCRSAWETDFATMLTAAYAKEKVNEHYNHKDGVLFYTMGYVIDPDIGPNMMNVMNPSLVLSSQENHVMAKNMTYSDGSVPSSGDMDLTQEIIDAWEELSDSDEDGITIRPYIASGHSTASKYFAQKDRVVKKVDGFPSGVSQMEYVTQYFAATSAQELIDKFAEIVQAISLQDPYEVTMTEQTLMNESGYVTFVDTLGEHMTLRKMDGIILGGEFYSGIALSRNFIPSGGALGTLQNPTALGLEFNTAVQRDLGLGTLAEAVKVIEWAYLAKQISYNPSNSDFSNYIEWYASVNGNDGSHTYKGFSHGPDADCDGDGQPDNNCSHITPPSDAAYRIRSYLHLGAVTTDEDGALSNTDMMYTLVWHRERLSDGQESVIFAVPAALLPTVDYVISLDLHKEIDKLEVGGATSPVVLAYQVGLKEEMNLEQIVKEDQYPYINKDENGKPTSVYLYSNKFDLSDVYNTANTHAYFRPNSLNDRYYYTGPINEKQGSNTPIYVKQGDSYVPYAGSRPQVVEGNPNTYFEKFIYYTNYEGDTKLDKPVEKVEWKPISAHALSLESGHDHLVQDGNGYWYVKAGTAHAMSTATIADAYTHKKTSNNTKTADTSEIAFVNVEEKTSGTYIIGTMQGNNGRLEITPISLRGTKSMDVLTDLSEYEFDFEVHQTGADFAWSDSTLLETVHNSGEQKTEIDFSDIWPTQIGGNYYVVREKPKDGVICDTTEYHITVTVGDGLATRIADIHEKGSDVNLVKDMDYPVLGFDQFNFVNKLGVELPKTGGAGMQVYIFLGAGLMTFAVLIYLTQRKKTRGVRH